MALISLKLSLSNKQRDIFIKSFHACYQYYDRHHHFKISSKIIQWKEERDVMKWMFKEKKKEYL